MFVDPQIVTINAISNSLGKTSSGDNKGEYRKDDGNVVLSVSHSLGKRNRRLIKLSHRKVAADPLNTAQNLNYGMTMSIIVDSPSIGYTPAEVKQVWDGFLANLAASSGANTVKFLAGES